MSLIPVPSVVLHAHTVLHKAWVLTLAYPVVRERSTTLRAFLAYHTPVHQAAHGFLSIHMSDMRSNDPTVFEHLVQAKLPVTAIASGKVSFSLWQEKNKGRSGWDFLREGGEGGILEFRVHPTCMLQWCFHK